MGLNARPRQLGLLIWDFWENGSHRYLHLRQTHRVAGHPHTKGAKGKHLRLPENPRSVQKATVPPLSPFCI